MTGCLRPAPVDLPILAGIQSAEFRGKRVTLSIARRATEAGHLHHSALTCRPSENARHLNSTHPFVPDAQQLISSSDDNNRNAALWVDHRWNAERLKSTASLRTFIPRTQPPGMALTRTAYWVTAPALVSNVSTPVRTHGRRKGGRGKFLFNPPETKQMTFFAKNLI